MDYVDDGRTVLHLISTDTPDLIGETLHSSGCDPSDFQRYPAVAYEHEHDFRVVVADCLKLWTLPRGVWALTRFRDTKQGRDALALVHEGLAGWSVSAKGVREIPRDGPPVYLRWRMQSYCMTCRPLNLDTLRSERPLSSAMMLDSADPSRQFVPSIATRASSGRDQREMLHRTLEDCILTIRRS